MAMIHVQPSGTLLLGNPADFALASKGIPQIFGSRRAWSISAFLRTSAGTSQRMHESLDLTKCLPSRLQHFAILSIPLFMTFAARLGIFRSQFALVNPVRLTYLFEIMFPIVTRRLSYAFLTPLILPILGATSLPELTHALRLTALRTDLDGIIFLDGFHFHSLLLRVTLAHSHGR